MKAGIFKFKAAGTPRNDANNEHFNEGNMNTEQENDSNVEGAPADAEGNKDQVILTIGKGGLQEKIVVDPPVSQEQLARIAHLAMHLNSAFGSLGAKPDVGVQRHWREMVTKKWKEKGLIDPNDPSFLYLAARNPDKANTIVEGLKKAQAEFQSNRKINDGLPEDSDLAESLADPIKEPKHLLLNFLRKGQVGIISGASKTHKSWTTMELALAVSQGGRFLKWEGVTSKVFYVDTELEKIDFDKRITTIARAKGMQIDKGEIRRMLLRGTRTTLDELVPRLIKRLRGKRFDLICIDAIYSVLGNREENSNDDIAAVGALLFDLAKQTDTAVVFTHHFSKGSQAGKRGIEKASGAGAWGRFPDASLAIDAHPQEYCYNIEPTLRTFPSDKPFVARRDGHVWKIEPEIKVESRTKKGSDLNDILQVLGDQTISPGAWQEQACSTLGISERAFQDKKKKALDGGWIKQEGKGKTTLCWIADNVSRNPETGRFEKK